jgi:hypothetical protein
MTKVDDYRKAYAAELAKETPSKSAMGAAAQAQSAAGIQPDEISRQIGILRDPAQPKDARFEALRNVQTATFMGPRFDPYRAAYRDALRGIAKDEQDQGLRAAALETLSLGNDDVARDLLLKGLEQGLKLPVSIAKAVQLLGHDDHGAAVPIAHKVLAGSYALDAKEEAARVLATDSNAESLLSGILSDKKQPKSLRSVTASSLRTLNPKRFIDVAARIVSDDSEDDEVRASCLGALNHVAGHLAKIDAAFTKALTNIATSSKSEELRKVADTYLRKWTPR